MNEKRIPLEKEEPKHKKKSQGNGLPRSKHKHEYEPVLLHREFCFHLGEPKTETITSVTLVCQICGRIDKTLRGDEWYDTEYKMMSKYRIGEKKLNEKALALPKYTVHEYFDKFAHRKE